MGPWGADADGTLDGPGDGWR
jgi:hypothetical protein